MTSSAWTLEDLSETARGFRVPLVVLTLVRTGVLGRLASGPAGAHDLAATCGVDAGALARLLNVVVSVGLLRYESGVYSVAGDLADDLARSGIGTPMDSLAHTAEGLDKWMRIEQVLVDGSADFPDEMDVTLDPQRNERFIRAMHAYAGPVARRFADLIDAGDVRTFLDVGGGPGTFCLAMLRRWPDLAATVADLPLTLRITREIIAREGVGDRLSVLEADFYADRDCDLAGPWDMVLVSAVIHAEGEEQNRDLFGRLRSVVAPGGRIVVRESILSATRTGPPRATLFDVHMLVSTRRGRCYTAADISQMLQDAGFRDPGPVGEAEDGLMVAYA